MPSKKRTEVEAGDSALLRLRLSSIVSFIIEIVKEGDEDAVAPVEPADDKVVEVEP